MDIWIVSYYMPKDCGIWTYIAFEDERRAEDFRDTMMVIGASEVFMDKSHLIPAK